MSTVEPGRPGKQPHTLLLSLCAIAPLLLAALVLTIEWPHIPHRFAVHWGLNGQPNGWGYRTRVGVFWPIFAGVLLVCGMAALQALIEHTQRPSAMREAVIAVLRGAAWLEGLAFAGTALLPLCGAKEGCGWLLVAGAFLYLLLLAAYAMHILLRARGGAWNAQTTGQPPGEHGDRASDASAWRAGLIYYNPADPSIFVEKRNGLGYTINFARPVGWIILAALVLLPLIALTIGRIAEHHF